LATGPLVALRLAQQAAGQKCCADGPAGHVGARAAIGGWGPTADWRRIS